MKRVSLLVNIGTVFFGILLVTLVISLIVKKKMSESQAVLWICIGVVAVILGIFPGLIPLIAELLGIWYAPSILLLVACIGLLLITFRNSVVLSEHTDELHELAITIALLKDENEELKRRLAEKEID